MGQAPAVVVTLIEPFERNSDAYKSQGYNETQLRREFLDPFFEALGWDVANKSGHAEAYKDVIHEDAIKIGGYTKAPDYCFRIGGARKFFLEAKKPAVNLKDEINPAYQLRRYAWSAKLPLSILTDFEEFAVYDCRTRPSPSDKASAGRILYLTYQDYLEQWDKIAAVFTKDAVLKGSFDKYAVTDRKRGTATVDAEFLKEIETWRETLAKNLALRNPKLTVHELNFSVQRTIDRLIFIRICEDRGVELYGKLQALLNGQNVYDRLRYLYDQADDRYNSGLFHFRPEKDRAELPDDLTPLLKIDDKVLKDIIGRLYYPNSPYEFSVFPTEILGQVYEQFLGKVIRLTSGHQAKVEEKPEVKKAGGVYYTPAYIVEYIVKQTVGVLCKEKTPKQIAKLRILDPACGSGSFLIGAYQYLLNYHRDWYVEDGAEKHRKELYQTVSGEWRLTTQEKKRILLNNIYGVDIDSQAVEVTKLSLLLKVLEGESDETLKRQLSFVHERALPDLGRNIKCGNSLIGSDYFAGQLIPDEDEMRRVNPFDWNAGFPEIIQAGGFDAVIGNPPYLNVDDTWGKGDPRLRALKLEYPEIYNDKTDILFYFLGKAVQLSKAITGFIVSRAFLEAYKADKLRQYLLNNSALQQIIDFQNLHIFPGVGITTCIFIYRPHAQGHTVTVHKLKPNNFCSFSEDNLIDSNSFETIKIDQSDLSKEPWNFASADTARLNHKLDRLGIPLKNLLIIGQGMQTGENQVFGNRTWQEIQKWKLKKGTYFKRAANSDIGRFVIKDRGEYLLFLEDISSLKDVPSGVQKYLLEHADALKGRAAYKRENCEWWKYTWPLHKEYYNRRRILCPYLAMYNRFALDPSSEFLGLTDTTVMFENNQPENLFYLLGLLNSKLLTFRFKHIGKLKGGGIYEYFWNSVSKIPIRRIDFSIVSHRTKHDQMVSLVERMLDLRKRLSDAKPPSDKERLQRQINATDQEIDHVVYNLYELTEDEIKIVEEATVASTAKVAENSDHERETEQADQLGSNRSASAGVAQSAQHRGEGGGSAPEGPAAAGKRVHGVREPASQYGATQDLTGSPKAKAS